MSDNSRRYSTWAGIIPAGGSETVYISGTYIAALACDGDLRLSIDGEPPGAFFQGLTLNTGGHDFVRLDNPGGADVPITIAIGRGDLRDGRLSATAPLDIANLPADYPDAATAAAVEAVRAEIAGGVAVTNHPAAVAVNNLPGDYPDAATAAAANTVINLLLSSTAKRSALTPLGQSHAASASSGLVTLLSPAANVNGAMLRHAATHCWGGEVGFYADTSAPSAVRDASKRVLAFSAAGAGHETIRDFILSPGVGLYVYASGSTHFTYADWDLMQ